MAHGALAIVEQWQAAVNAGDVPRLQELSAEAVEIVGPRGGAYGRSVLADWMRRAGLSWQPVRWFCGGDGTVVVEQDVRWTDPDTGRELGSAVVGSWFSVADGVVTRYARHDSLAAALDFAGLTVAAEVTARN